MLCYPKLKAMEVIQNPDHVNVNIENDYIKEEILSDYEEDMNETPEKMLTIPQEITFSEYSQDCNSVPNKDQSLIQEEFSEDENICSTNSPAYVYDCSKGGQTEHTMSSLCDSCTSDKGNNEPGTSKTSVKFQIKIAAIQSIPKDNQALELQNLEGLSVYDQSVLEEGIRLQVDQALELEAPGPPLLVNSLEPDKNVSDLERQISLGEMTPFGTSLNKNYTSDIVKPIDGLSIIEKYLSKQLELQGKRKPKSLHQSKQLDNCKCPKVVKTKAKKDLKNKIIKNRKKRTKKEDIGTEVEDFVPWTERPGPVAGEQEYMYNDDVTGSEYEPSDSEYLPSSEDEGKYKKIKQKKLNTIVNRRKRKLSSRLIKSSKIPEDWASDDSDWEYSDEEENLKRVKRRKKEQDDGDVDVFSRRIRAWKHERKEAEIDESSQLYHILDDEFKVPQDIWDKLYNYQQVGVQWLWELVGHQCGGILGDEMGLGKTIQVIAFLAGLHSSQLKDKETNYRGLGPTLIVCPTTVMHQWVHEFHKWYPPLRVGVLHESGTFCGKQRSKLISAMVQASGVLITSYTGVTQHKDDIITKRWHYVILDEGHKIRNPDAQVTLVVKQLQTPHRIVLSGSPMQNSLKELWSLFDFVYPGKLGTLPVFLEQFAVPITQGGYANASQVQVVTAFKCATVLKDTIAPYLLRRMKADVKIHVQLPEKNEQVLFCRLTEEQRYLYKGYVESGEVSGILEGRLKIFMGLIRLRKICNHPDLYSGGPNLLPGQNEDVLPEAERYGHWSKSGKMIVVETLLKLWHKQGHRVLVFTQSRQMLSIMEAFVKQADYKYLKMDGTTSVAARQPLINKFNQDASYFLILLTTRVGGLGVNLTGANRVLIYDPDWNPATDTQARERAWRIGQRQSVTVYRLITAGTIEEKMYHRQIFKQFLCNKVLKDPRQRRFFKSNDLYELFTLKETDVEGSTETGAIFAGTGSEVKLDPTKSYKHRKIDPKRLAEPPPKTFARKRAEKKKKNEDKKSTDSALKDNVCFSDEKINRMKKLAQMLSKRVVKNILQVVETKTSEDLLGDRAKTTVDDTSTTEVMDLCTQNNIGTNINPLAEQNESNFIIKSDVSDSPNKSIAHSHNRNNSCLDNLISTDKHKSKHKDKKKRKPKDAMFEGETVPHLVKAGVSASKSEQDITNKEKHSTQDDYVLQKLFARSGLQTALRHDTIMEGGPADFVLVEEEADRVAKQAVKKLQTSQRECWQAASGIPNFTGNNGARNIFSKRFGKTKSTVGEMSSSSLVDAIRNRNCNRLAKDSEVELVRDIRDFLSSQGGTVHTTQLIDRFEGRLPEGSSPLFKSLLGKICTFYRGPDKLGYWTLREVFNW